MKTPAKLALEDGSVFAGEAVGAEGESVGEVVFNTSLTGYQEIFTDPSYNGQMVVMTNPLIGNYGINPEDAESFRPFVRGVIVREMSRRPSNFRSSGPLGEYLKKFNVIGIAGVDTRAITKRIRLAGSLKGVIATRGDQGAGHRDPGHRDPGHRDPGHRDPGHRDAVGGGADFSDAALVEKARQWTGLDGQDMVSEVTTKKLDIWRQGLDSPFANCFKSHRVDGVRGGAGLRIAAFDLGIKYNILRILCDAGFEVHVFPASASADEVRAIRPDGVFLSNGPGDPEGLPYVIKTIRDLVSEYPTFGICLGHQLTGLALGATTYKLKFGHHGGNHPVKNLVTGKVDISVQNHCYAIDQDSLGDKLRPYFLNLNDGSLEGLYHTELPLFTVQFHPESAPGPNDYTYLFDQYAAMIRERRPLPALESTLR